MFSPEFRRLSAAARLGAVASLVGAGAAAQTVAPPAVRPSHLFNVETFTVVPRASESFDANASTVLGGEVGVALRACSFLAVIAEGFMEVRGAEVRTGFDAGVAALLTYNITVPVVLVASPVDRDPAVRLGLLAVFAHVGVRAW